MKKIAAVLIIAAVSLTGANLAAAQDVCVPAKVIDLQASTGKTTAVIGWTAPGDDCNTGTATSYDLRYSTSPITEGNFASATSISTGSPQAAGSTECVELSGLSCNTTYYFALKTTDDAGFVSPLSNVPSAATRPCNQSQEVVCP